MYITNNRPNEYDTSLCWPSYLDAETYTVYAAPWWVSSRYKRSVGLPRRTAMTLQQHAARIMVHSHTRWDGMGWAALKTQCVNASIEIHWVTSTAHPIAAQRVYECIINVRTKRRDRHTESRTPDWCVYACGNNRTVINLKLPSSQTAYMILPSGIRSLLKHNINKLRLMYVWRSFICYFAPTPGGMQSIVISMSICLSVSVCLFLSAISPPLAALRYVMYFMFWGWRHVSHRSNGPYDASLYSQAVRG